MPSTQMRDGMSREVAGRRWSLAEVLAFYETHNELPFSLAGGATDGDGDGGADGDGNDDTTDGKGGDGDGKAGDAGGANGDGGKPKTDATGEDVSGLKSALKAERDANKPLQALAKKRGITVQALVKELSEAADAGKSEFERLTGERDTLKATADTYRDKYRKATAAESIRSEALTMGADPRRVDRIVRMVKADVAFDDDDDTPSNIKALLTDLKKSDSDLFTAIVGKGDGGAGNNGKPTEGNATAVLRKALGRSA